MGLKNGIELGMHPQGAGGSVGYKNYKVFDGLGDVLIENDAVSPDLQRKKT
ncbi:MAG: hypothetical protein IPQ19_15400 [Bacteroidetes bacterium]|nr:hypothetical protein [Bacteroidota bacterium]